MPSTYSLRFRFDYQAPGDNLNTWGTKLNTAVFQLIEDALAKRVAFSLSGSKTLTTANGAEDEARCAFLDVTSGSGGTITIPSVEKLYVVRNAASGDVTVTTGGATVAVLKPGEIGWVVCDGATVRRVQSSDFGGARITSVGAPVASTDAATKGYVDATAFESVNLPGQGVGTVGAALFSDGTSAGWRDIEVADVGGAAPAASPAFTGEASLSGSMTQDGPSFANAATVTAGAIDLTEGNFHQASISTNTTFTFNGAEAGLVNIIVLNLTISSAAVPTWPASVDWPGGLSPTFGNGSHRVGFISFDGTNWAGLIGGLGFA